MIKKITYITCFFCFMCQHILTKFYYDSGKQIIWHGSFNFTGSGYKHNCESILIIEDHAAFKNFEKEFERIKKQSNKYKPK